MKTKEELLTDALSQKDLCLNLGKETDDRHRLAELRNILFVVEMTRQAIEEFGAVEIDENNLTITSKRLEYLTGFSGSNGLAIILENTVLFFTDGRYLNKVKQELNKIWEKIKPSIESLGITKIIPEIVSGCKNISLKLFEGLDKETCVYIYNFLSKHRYVLHLNEKILEAIRELVEQKFENVMIYKLNPTINDLLNSSIYKLNVNDEFCYVPLWISESYFDISGCEVIVLCEPELSDNIIIDEYNNIHTVREVSILNELTNLVNSDMKLTIEIAGKVFEIPTEHLYMKKEQTYIIKNKGLNIADDFDISNFQKSDIIVLIKLI
jgi:hypothetical protein